MVAGQQGASNTCNAVSVEESVLLLCANVAWPLMQGDAVILDLQGTNHWYAAGIAVCRKPPHARLATLQDLANHSQLWQNTSISLQRTWMNALVGDLMRCSLAGPTSRWDAADVKPVLYWPPWRHVTLGNSCEPRRKGHNGSRHG